VVTCYRQLQLRKGGALELQVKLVESLVADELLLRAFHLSTEGGR
jgi:hypothetical protein